uniref:Glycosyltransferase 2-like domain-containing protein n=1 Tax=Ditylenchus dipsaci TaxID=166011 RepID=A0A915EHN8_9BILA
MTMTFKNYAYDYDYDSAFDYVGHSYDYDFMPMTFENTAQYAVIVVDDGSRDGTTKVAFEYSKTYPVYIHSLQANFGKGGAVREGVLCARGQLILFADADGATTFSEFAKLEKEIYKLCNGQQSSASNLLTGPIRQWWSAQEPT